MYAATTKDEENAQMGVFQRPIRISSEGSYGLCSGLDQKNRFDLLRQERRERSTSRSKNIAWMRSYVLRQKICRYMTGIGRSGGLSLF